MKKLILPFAALTIFAACKKTSTAVVSDNLTVEEKNMAVVAKRTATWCHSCGSWGFPQFESLKQTHGNKAVYMAWKDSYLSSEGDHLFTEVGPKFNLGNSVPTFFNNFDANAGSSSINEHVNADVMANSNYEFTVSGTQVNLKTTTKFFQNTEGDFFVAPYMIVDHQRGQQNFGGTYYDTVHHNYVAKIAKPTSVSNKKDWGYKVGTGKISKGHTVSLEFEATRDIAWQENDISFALVIYKEQADSLVFVNAFTK